MNHYRYDPLDRLTDVGSLRRFYCAKRIANEIEGGNTRYFFEYNAQSLAQHQGPSSSSVLLATDLQKCVLHSVSPQGRRAQTYSPYGYHPVQHGLPSPQGFNGERPEAVTGHYLLGQGYRAFNPVLMRFNSPDSWSPFGKGGTNAYAYCKGDPINHVDPDGHLTLYPLKIQVITLDVVQRGRPRAPVNTRLLRSRSPSPPNFIPPPPPAPAARVPAHSVPVVTTPVGRLRPAPPPPDLMPPPPPVLVQTSRAPNSAATVSNTISSIRET